MTTTTKRDRHILVVDDDAAIREVVRVMLERSGYLVFEAASGSEALHKLYDEHPDLVVLDITMPGMDGFETLGRIRDLTDTPVIMLTARTLEAEKVRALKAGADDYVTKPFGKQELVARVEALLRRGIQGNKSERYSDGLVSIDFAQRKVAVNETAVALTPLEFKLLAVLVRHPDQVLSRDQLLDLVWGTGDGSSSGDEVKVYIGYLRRKLEQAGAPKDLIETVRGFGYSYKPIEN